MHVRKVKEFTIPIKSAEGNAPTIQIKVYPNFLGWVLSWLKKAQLFVAEDQTYYITNKTKRRLCNTVLKKMGGEQLPDGCRDTVAFQIFAEAIFNSKETVWNRRQQPPKAVINDPALEAMNFISPVPIVRRNDITWVRENVKPGAILVVHAHNNFKPTTAIITGAQAVVRSSSVDPRDVCAMHTLVCVAPGKFAEATPSKTGDQVRIIDFNQSYHDLPIGSNAEFQVFEPDYAQMEPLQRDFWEKRFAEMVRIAKDCAVSNTGIEIDDPAYAQYIDRSFVPGSVVKSKLKYAHFDALRSILKFGRFNSDARVSVFEQVCTQALGLDTPYTAKGEKRSFICSSFNAWLLQAMQHEEILTLLKGKLAEQGKGLDLPKVKQFLSEPLKPELSDLIGKSKAEKKQAKRVYRQDRQRYKDAMKEVRKVERYNGRLIHKWAQKMYKKHSQILRDNLEFKVNSRYCNPMDVKDMIRKRPDVLRLTARIIPALEEREPIKV